MHLVHDLDGSILLLDLLQGHVADRSLNDLLGGPDTVVVVIGQLCLLKLRVNQAFRLEYEVRSVNVLVHAVLR